MSKQATNIYANRHTTNKGTSNPKSMIEVYNELFKATHNAVTHDDMIKLYPKIKDFVYQYEEVDKTSTDRIYSGFSNKLKDMIEENTLAYDLMNDKVEAIKNRQYDYGGEKDDTQAVQSKVLQLMAELPKTKTTANSTKVSNVLNAAITSGVIGSKAVLDLLKYPAYSGMVNETMKQRAYVGSKSEAQHAFERINERELEDVRKSMTSIFSQGFHAKNLQKKVIDDGTQRIWE